MGKELKITTVKYAKAPDRKAARFLLHEIVKKPASFEPRKVDKQLILYGAAKLGKLAKDYFDRLGIPFLFVVDVNPDRHRKDPFWEGIDILGINDVPVDMRESALFAICVGTESFTKVRAPLIENGWRDVVPFYDISEAYREFHPLSNGWYSGSLDKSDIFGIESALCRWEDDISRAHHLQFIAWRSLREEWFFDDAPVTINDRFFIPEILSSLHKKEVFLDGGAHHGEVSLRFMDMVHHKFKKVYAIEPDKHNVNVLRNKLCCKNLSTSQNIQIIECALGRQSGSVPFFHGLDYASQISWMGQESIPVRILDEMDISVTFIKLHLEGWEYEALLGSMCTLRKYRPLMTVTIYHNRKGLWQIPHFLMKNLQDYVFLLRLHSWMGTGCVLYAIPRERYNLYCRQGFY